MSCIHLGEKAGSVVSTCCGGREKLIPLHACLNNAKPEDHAVPNRADHGMALIDVGGERSMKSVAGCVGCKLMESEDQVPKFDNPKPQTLARKMWEDLRRRRNTGQPKIDPIIENFTTFKDHGARPIHTKHLLYHIWPKKDGYWQRPLNAIKSRLDLFNGKKVVAIAMDDDADQSIRDHLTWADEIIEVKNNPKLREVASFVPLMSRVEEYRDGHATFMCHSKGVRHHDNDGTTVHSWSDVMLETLLDYWDYTNALLSEYPIVGSIKKVGRSLSPTAAEWHYTGSYVFMNNADVFTRNWKRIDQIWWGTESWPGVHYKPDEAGCTFMTGPSITLNMYDMKFFLDQVVPRLEFFRATMQGYRT